MASRRVTLTENRFPTTPEFCAVARAWDQRAILTLLMCVWRGYDLLFTEVLRDADWAVVRDDLERDISQQLELRIRRVMPAILPYEVQHGPFERESRSPAPAQPPQYDIAFILRQNPRVMWPLEAKILRTTTDIDDYTATIRERLLACKYAPFSSEAAMMGYLLNGQPAEVFASIEAALGCQLVPPVDSDLTEREHRVSDHVRAVPTGKSYPASFRCHHLVMALSA